MNTYLAFGVDCFEPFENSRFWATANDGINSVQHEELEAYPSLVSFSFERLAPFLHRGSLRLSPGVIDVAHLQTYLWGKVSLSLLEDKLAGIERSGSITKEDLGILKAYRRTINGAWTKEEQPDDILSNILSRLVRIHNNLEDALKSDLVEYERYSNIEIPILAMTRECESKGIGIDTIIASRHRQLAHDEWVRTSAELRHTYGVLNTYDREGLSKALERIGSTLPVDEIVEPFPKTSLKDLAVVHPLFRLLYEQRRAKSDKRQLLQIEASPGRIFPIYDTLGSKTSRIILKNPPIQFLRKEFRDVIVPSEGNGFVYCDYSQFEPGILADLSGDEELIRLYNESDIYTELSRALFDNMALRSEAKAVFLAFCYGMSEGYLPLMAHGIVPSLTIDEARERLESFFHRFYRMQNWRKELESELLRAGRMGSISGNYRYRLDPKLPQLTGQEKRWVMSHKVQGTASLIFKQALLSVGSGLRLPMHDAALFEIPLSEAESFAIKVNDSFISAMSHYCPSLKPKVVFSNFST